MQAKPTCRAGGVVPLQNFLSLPRTFSIRPQGGEEVICLWEHSVCRETLPLRRDGCFLAMKPIWGLQKTPSKD